MKSFFLYLCTGFLFWGKARNKMNDCLDYYFGIAATVYLTTCWAYAAIRKWHTCRAPKDRLDYIWPDRKLQVLVYTFAVVLLPYVLNPTSVAAWEMEKAYFPATYYFYCGVLMLRFFGSVKQWNKHRVVSWMAAILVVCVMLPLVLNAWLPTPFFTPGMYGIWRWVLLVEGFLMMWYAGFAMYQVKVWIEESRDDNYSNPDDFPTDYANRVWLAPVIFTPFLWLAFIFDSRLLMAVSNIVLAVLNIVLLINVMPVWRRFAILPAEEDEGEDEEPDMMPKATAAIVKQIEKYVIEEQAYLNPHLKFEDVVARCSYNRTYVSRVFKKQFGGFANYVNCQRLAYFEKYSTENPSVKKEVVAELSGFGSYNAYYKANRKRV